MKKHTGNNDHLMETPSEYFSALPKRMFSPASFAEFLSATDFVAETPAESREDTPPIVSFYGLKGGSGRSLGLAYSAVLLARRGLKVGVVDFDFEAPGLHAIFGIENAELGSLAILEDGNYRNRPLDIWKSITTIPIESRGKVMVMTAGKIDADYLKRLDNLRPLLWDEYDSQPITRLLSAFSVDDFDVVLIDCRTGFHGITASLLFHYSNLVVSFFPLSEQIWDGIEVVSEAWKNVRRFRNNAPDWLIVPAMVPAGRDTKIQFNIFVEKLRSKFRLDVDSDTAEGDNDDVWLMPDGISYHPGIAMEGRVPREFSPGGAWQMFEPLVEQIADSLAIGSSPHSTISVDYASILDEVTIPASNGFAEELNKEEIERLLVPSEDLKEAIDPSMAIVVGAKGSGKTLVWRCCVEPKLLKWVNVDENYLYIVGHPPRNELDASGLSITRAEFERLERDGQMRETDSYEQFWLFYGLYRLCHQYPNLVGQLARKIPTSARASFKRLMKARKLDLLPILKDRVFLDLQNDLILESDQFLRDAGNERIVLCYDGLDTDFQGVDLKKWVERRNHFVKGLLLLVSEYRGRLHRIRFKVFLREDIYLSIDGLQNKSHMEAYKKELRFQSRDVWRLVMNLVHQSSPTFQGYVTDAAPGLNPPWDIEEKKLKDLLDVLWGRVLGKGNKAISTNYIIKRISDSQGRLFPRTFVQMLRQAFSHAKNASPTGDRVLPHQSLTKGVEEASVQRTQDLTAEYVELTPFFKAMEGLKANFNEQEFTDHVNRRWREDNEETTANCSNALIQLEHVGVLSKKERTEDTTWSVALMYRPGLRVKGAGLN